MAVIANLYRLNGGEAEFKYRAYDRVRITSIIGRLPWTCWTPSSDFRPSFLWLINSVISH